MKQGEITLRASNNAVLGVVKVSLKFDIPKEMMQMLVNDVSKGVQHWEDKIILHEHGNNQRQSLTMIFAKKPKD